MSNVQPQKESRTYGLKLAEQDPQFYEESFLTALLYNRKLWRAISPNFCISTETGKSINEFDFPLHYPIYRAIKAHRGVLRDAPADSFGPVAEEYMRFLLKSFSAEAIPCIDESQVEEAVSLYRQIASPERELSSIALVQDSYKDWMLKQRSKRTMLEINRSSTAEDITSALTDLTTFRADIETEDEDEMEEFGASCFRTEEMVERIPLGRHFTRLSECLGGGLGKQEHVIFAAPTGGGKTVLACQLAASLAASGNNVLYITTEQHSRELTPRVISCMSADSANPIPFAIIKDTGDYDRVLTPEQIKMAKQIIGELRGKLHWANWLGSGKSATLDLEPLVRDCKKRYGSLDVIILDWIGSALTEGVVDSNEVRQLYLKAAEAMKNMSIRHNVACVSMTQASADAVGKTKVTEQYIAECKTIHREATAAFGISAIRADDSGEEKAASYAKRQYVTGFKSRKSSSSSFWVERDFGYQRFLKF